jgi:hypothetical protein
MDGSIQEGVWSNEISLTSAWTPYAPNEVSTTIVGSNLRISWSAGATGNSAITGYVVTILRGDGSNTYSPTTCATNTLTTTCDIALSTLQANFALVYPTAINARVLATNTYGNGATSSTGTWVNTPAFTPSTPTNLRLSSNTDTTITVTWDAISSNGGAQLTQYTVSA